MKENDDEFEVRKLGDEEYYQELCKKLVEEANEVATAEKDYLLGELADVLECVKSIASHGEIGFNEVITKQEDKREKRGGFEKRLFLEWSTGKGGK